MTKLIDAMRTSDTLTENGMVTNSTTLDSCLDLFFVIGAVRPLMKTEEGRQRLIRKFEAARNQDGLITRKLMFWARDAREGAGEREAFRVLLRYASEKYSDEVISNIHLIAEYGRWDDVFVTFGTPVERAAIELIRKNLEDRSKSSLLAKWMPRTGGKVSAEKRLIANKVRLAMGMSSKEFRKFLVERTNVIETSMCKKDYSEVEYSKVPSLAMARYQKAFMKNDPSGFEKYKNALVKGETKINAGAVYPYDIIKTLRFRGSEDVAMKQWEALPNYMEGSNERVLPVCDVSGSMSTAVSGGNTTALDVCLSLGLYISERNVGPFKDAFVTFSDSPKLQVLNGNLRSRLQQLIRADWNMNTNLEATFDVILNQAVKHNVPQEEMPTCILIMSDMEFDACVSDKSAFGMIEEKYARAGYQLPKVVFWNISARHDNFPVQKHQNGTGLVSGFSPSVLKSVLTGDVMNPVQIMLRTINTPRYESIQ